ncbi:MAG: alpha/beta hydrolase, partial [Muribaculaceae bacterium]
LYEHNGLLGNVIDNMTNNGDIEPIIMVFPTFNYNNVVPETVMVAGDYAKGLSCEVARDLIPYVESRYRTYATATSKDGIIDSRDHRAFGGFSMGGVATWFVFDHCTDYFRYYIPISGCCWSIGYRGGKYRADETASYLAKQVINSKFGADGVRIYAASGTKDKIYSELETQIKYMLQYSDTFTPRNLYFYSNIGAEHLWVEVQDYLYTILPLIFPCSAKDAN